jgi:hypothetical protein
MITASVDSAGKTFDNPSVALSLWSARSNEDAMGADRLERLEIETGHAGNVSWPATLGHPARLKPTITP